MNRSKKLEMYNNEGSEKRKMKENFRNSVNLEDLKTRTHLSPPTTHISGITLVALVVTIVVLLILAGVTITALLGDDGIIKKAQNAADLMNNAIQNEQNEMNALLNELDEAINGMGTGGTAPGGDEPAQGKLEIGSEVTYSPSGTYDWNNEYASSDQTGITALNSATEESYNISTWKVLSIDEDTRQVELIASAPTTGTVRLHGAQGYNNAVKLLNDACDSLYGDDAKGIEGRSVDIDDIEKYMTEEALTGAHQETSPTSNTQYGNQVSSAYSTSNSRYPVIYAQEKKAVITKSDGNVNNVETGLDLSEQTRLIERLEGTSSTSSIGAITTATSIQPYQTFWYKDATFMETAFEDANNGVKYYSLFMPNGTSTTYWMASRCVAPYSAHCRFLVSVVSSGNVSGGVMCYSYGNFTLGFSHTLFPVITLSSELIEGNASSGFSIN